MRRARIAPREMDRPRRRRAKGRGAAARWSDALRYAVEALEGRRLLSTVTWDGGAGNDSWTAPLNWDLNLVPTTGDDVLIPAGASVRLSSGTQDIGSLRCDGSFTLTGGTLSIAGASSLNGSLTMSGGTIGGAGDLT